jgi:hypothetical protein
MYFYLPFCVKSVKCVNSVKLNVGNYLIVGNPIFSVGNPRKKTKEELKKQKAKYVQAL